METTCLGNERIKDIVNDFPQSVDIFKHYGIDYCCNGKRTLIHAIQQQHLDEDEVLETIIRSYKETEDQLKVEKDWRLASSSDLIDHIIVTHHAYLRKELPIIGEFVAKILRKHHQEMLFQLHKLYHHLVIEIEEHLIEEEEVLFPLIKQFDHNPSKTHLEKLTAVIIEMETEHSGVGHILKAIREVTNDFTLPEGACTTFAVTFTRLANLEDDMHQHIHLENNILFPRIYKSAI